MFVKLDRGEEVRKAMIEDINKLYEVVTGVEKEEVSCTESKKKIKDITCVRGEEETVEFVKHI